MNKETSEYDPAQLPEALTEPRVGASTEADSGSLHSSVEQETDNEEPENESIQEYRDTDLDGASDFEEMMAGTNRLDPLDNPVSRAAKQQQEMASKHQADWQLRTASDKEVTTQRNLRLQFHQPIK